MLDDQQLVQETLAGKTSSFEQLVRKYQDRLFHSLVHVTGSTHEAEDVVQEAMIQAFTKLKSFQGNSSFYTWLYRIAFNQSISRQRKKRPRVSLNSIQENAGFDAVDSSESPADSLERNDRAVLLQKALLRLSDEFRTALVMREMDGFDYETISQMLEIPIGTVRSRIYRARTMLRDQLNEAIGES